MLTVQDAPLGRRVILSAENRERAEWAARARQDSAVANGRPAAHNAPEKYAKALYLHRQGAIGEAVVAQALGIPVVLRTNRPDRNNEPDVAHVNVRQTEHEDGHLTLYEKDHPEIPFVLVTGRINQNVFWIRGWDYGCKLKIDEHWTEFWRGKELRAPCYFVPQTALRPFDEMPREFRTYERWIQPVHSRRGRRPSRRP